jgi:S1-C subfamily serine protease
MNSQKKQFIISIVAAGILASFVFGFLGGFAANRWFLKENTQPGLSVFSGQIVSQDEAVVKVVKEVSPAVVSIIATKDLPIIEKRSQWLNPFGRLFPFQFEVPEYQQRGIQKQEVGGGTGFIVASDGLILTNKHVVDISGAEYTVLMKDGQKYSAKVLAKDPVQDIAVLEIDKKNLPTVRLGNSDKINIGQTAIAIGNALGEFRNTVSVGVISGLSRLVLAASGSGVENLEDLIQTDAAINPGNSGGPLLNLQGEVIGINTAMASEAQNIGFALPINSAKRDIDQVKKQGKITYPFIGIRYAFIDSQIKEEKKLPVDYGVLIVQGNSEEEPAIVSGSPAERAGLKEGDIILEVDGQKIDKEHSLANIVQRHDVGDEIALRILSNGKEKTIRIVLGER